MFKSKKRKRQLALANHGNLKSSDFDFERISLFFSHSDKADACQIIPYNTWRDLDFEKVFMYIDRTCSVIGQQYLYATLRTISKNKTPGFERYITYLDENPLIKDSAIGEISRLNNQGAYFLQRLIFGEQIVKPRWFWVLPILSILAVGSLVLSFFFPVLFFFLLPIIVINNIIHYWNKNNLLSYSNTIPQLLLLHDVTSRLLKANAVVEKTERVQTSAKSMRKVVRKAAFFKWESRMTDEIGQAIEYVSDLIKGFFLIEPILFFRLVKEIEAMRSEINDLFLAVVQIDVAISISSLRRSLPYYAIPTFEVKKKYFHATEMYHPLIKKPVSNDVGIYDQKSILISGSNMSGKTTFIRTLGINAILAQTINTVCCKEFVMPFLKVYSTIRIADNLMDETSYYYAEVKRIKKLLIASESESQCLFLLDELFKGTNTIERIASGKAVLSFLNRGDHLVFASTHDLELTEHLTDSFNYFHFSELVENGVLNFDYKLKDGQLSCTNAIKILEINDFPKDVTDEARRLATEMVEKKGIVSPARPS